MGLNIDGPEIELQNRNRPFFQSSGLNEGEDIDMLIGAPDTLMRLLMVIVSFHVDFCIVKVKYFV